MNEYLYFTLCGICVAAVLLGINMMSKVKSSVRGNGLSAIAMIFAIALIFGMRAWAADISRNLVICIALAAGAVVGIYGAFKAKMISMPQIIALLNGLGGAVFGFVEGGLLVFLAVWILRRFGVSFETELITDTHLFWIFTAYTPLSVLSLLC